MANSVDAVHLDFQNISLNGDALDNAGDLGVSQFKELSCEVLHQLLQMPCGRPPLFNTKLAWDRTITPWDFPGHQLPANEPTDKCALLWHQEGGVGTLGLRAWTVQRSSTPIPGTMLGDGVGVGKTLQYLSHIAFTMCVCTGELKPGTLHPPLIGK
jgi:hypothetical protein